MAAHTTTRTLLFTDIEGSTRLWERSPETMSVALARHDEIVRRAIEERGGSVFKTVGDAFCAVFPDPVLGVAAALAVHRSLAGEPWPAPAVVRVRAAVHVGACEERDGDYFGRPLNRVARLLAVGHGGQTLLSGSVARIVSEVLPAGLPGVVLRDLGEHRLKDLGEPEHIFQAQEIGSEASFPPLRSLGNPRLANNLPRQVASFVGRADDLTEVRARLDEFHLVTLAGTGGCGKSRLAVQLAAELLGEYNDGVWLVELAHLDDARAVAQAVMAAMDVRIQPGRGVQASVVEALADRAVLIVLDNCEHVLDGAAPLADALLRSCPMVTVLATSREPLGVYGESVYRLPSLPIPDHHETSLDRVAACDAVQLFAERATQRVPEFAISEGNAAAVASVCRRLDGMPLAIELAAARLDHMSIGEIDERLDDRFRLLTAGLRTALPRQQTLRALVDWSWDLLTSDEQDVLSLVSVCSGSFALDAVSAIAPSLPQWEVLESVRALVDKSLVQVDPSGGPTRYRLLETVRAYAAEQLAHRGTDVVEAARRAHCAHFLAVAERAAPELDGPDQREWFDRLEADRDNLRAALAVTGSDPQLADADARLRIALLSFWMVRGAQGETLDVLLAAPSPATDAPLRARALVVCGVLATQFGEHALASARLLEARTIAVEIGAEPVLADALMALAWLAFVTGEADRALSLRDEAVTVAAGGDDAHRMAQASRLLAMLLSERGAIAEACAADRVALELIRPTGNRRIIGLTLNNLAAHEVAVGQVSSARVHLQEALDIAQHDRDTINLVFVLTNLGFVAIVEHDYEGAYAAFAQSLAAAHSVGLRASEAYGLLGVALACTGRGDHELAARLHGAAGAAFERLGETLERLEDELRADDVETLRQALGDAVFDAAYAAGAARRGPDAIALAMRESF